LVNIVKKTPQNVPTSKLKGVPGLKFGIFGLVGVWCLVFGVSTQAQIDPALQNDPLVQLQVSQPNIEIVSNATATATFDPPIVRTGGTTTYRITFNALDDSIRWPRDINAPAELELRQSARAQIPVPFAGFKWVPLTGINYQVRATKAGSFTIPSFKVKVYGRSVTIPAATLQVTDDPAMPIPWAPTLKLQFAETNIYSGQPVTVRVLMPAGPGNVIQALSQMKVTGEGFVVDASATRPSIATINIDGQQTPSYIYETLFTSLVSGKVTAAAQAFTAGNRFEGPFVIQGRATIPGGVPQYVLVDSEPVTVDVKPLPRTGQLPGFTGGIGNFTNDPPILLTNQVQVGGIVKLEVTFRGEAVSRLLLPPPPKLAEWQIFPAEPGGLPIPNRPQPAPGSIARYTYTMIPMTNGLTATPAIPFSYFDPKRAAYVDMTIPAVPITVTVGAVQPDWPVGAETNLVELTEKKLALSPLTKATGRSAGSLVPLQRRGWFTAALTLPVLGFGALWAWDRRRRYLEAHPNIVLRRKARRALRRERRRLERARREGDIGRYASLAVTAMQVACAPHYPAEPRALVCGDILELFGEEERRGRTGEVVRKIFSFADASLFAGVGPETNGLLSLHSEFRCVLEKLEARL